MSRAPIAYRAPVARQSEHISTKDFNARVKRMMADKPELKKPEQTRKR